MNEIMIKTGEGMGIGARRVLRLLAVMSVALTGCSRWAPYVLPEQRMSGITFANNMAVLDTLNRYKYTSTQWGQRDIMLAIATNPVDGTSFRTVLTNRLVFTDTTIEYHTYQGANLSRPFDNLKPSILEEKSVACNKIKEVWVWSKADMHMGHARGVEGDYCIRFQESVYKEPLAVVITEDMLPGYIKAIMEVLPEAKLYRYKGPIGP